MHTIAGAHKPGCVRYMHTTQNTVATHPLFICINWNQMPYKPWHNKTVWVWMVQSDTSWVMRFFFNFPLQSLWKPWSCSYKLNIRPMTSCLTSKLLKPGKGWFFFSKSRSKFTESHACRLVFQLKPSLSKYVSDIFHKPISFPGCFLIYIITEFPRSSTKCSRKGKKWKKKYLFEKLDFWKIFLSSEQFVGTHHARHQAVNKSIFSTFH